MSDEESKPKTDSSEDELARAAEELERKASALLAAAREELTVLEGVDTIDPVNDEAD
jgi:hypothetical protein